MSTYTTTGFAFASTTAVYAIGADHDALEADIARECANASIDRSEMEFAADVPATAKALALVEAGVVEMSPAITSGGAYLMLHMGTLIASDEYTPGQC